MRRMNAFAGGSDSSGGWFEGVGDEVVVLFVIAMAAAVNTGSALHPPSFLNEMTDSPGHRAAPVPMNKASSISVGLPRSRSLSLSA